MWIRVARVAARGRDRRQRRDLRRAPGRLHRGRPAHGPRPLVPVQHGQARPAAGLRAAARSRRRRWCPTIEGEFARKRRMMSHGWLIVLRGGLLSPRGYGPLYALEIFSHRLLRYASPFLHLVALGVNVALARRGGAATWPRSRSSSRCSLGALVGRADRALLRTHDRVARRGPVGLAAPRDARRVGEGGGHAVSRLRRPPAPSCSPRRSSLAAMLAIRLESAGSPIYRQRRVGKDGEPFDMYKLRTMVADAEFMGDGLAVNRGDPRITRVGAFLRRFSIDELPNLVNVRARRDGDRRPAADDPGPGRPVHRAPAAAARGEAGPDRLGADQRAARRCRGPSGSSWTSGTSTTRRPCST